MSKDEICTCKACKNTVFHCQICKIVGFLLPTSSWLLKLPGIFVKLAVKHVMSKQSSLCTSFFRSFVTGRFILLMALFLKCWMVMPVFFQNHSLISLFPSAWRSWWSLWKANLMHTKDPEMPNDDSNVILRFSTFKFNCHLSLRRLSCCSYCKAQQYLAPILTLAVAWDQASCQCRILKVEDGIRWLAFSLVDVSIIISQFFVKGYHKP